MSCGGTELSYAFRTCCSAFSQIWAKMCFKPDFRFEFEMFGQSSGVVFLLEIQNASALMTSYQNFEPAGSLNKGFISRGEVY